MPVVLALAAAWLAAGSVGLMAHPLRRILTGLLVLAGIMVARPPGAAVAAGRALFWWGLLAAFALLAAPQPVVNVLAPAVVLAALAATRPGEQRAVWATGAQAVLLYAVYQFWVTLVPWGWMAADRVARWLGWAVSWVSPWPLEVGRTYAGLDFLVLTLAFGLLLGRSAGARGCPSPRWGAKVLSVGLVHLAYLFLVASFPRWREWLPVLETPRRVPGLPPVTRPLAEMVLWQLPWLGLILHAPLLAWWAWRAGRAGTSVAGAVPADAPHPVAQQAPLGRWAWLVLALAAAVPVVMLLNPRPLSLQGRKIVVYEKGFLNWLKPRHGEYGRLSVGMYGMWPAFCASYGAQCVISPDLAESDLAGADLLVLIFPNRPWEPGQLERIQRFVTGGGSLLVLGEHTVREKDGGSRFNEVLGPTAMQVAFDSAMFAVGGWLHSYQALAHPAALGIRDDRNQFGVVIGASVEAEWPAADRKSVV